MATSIVDPHGTRSKPREATPRQLLAALEVSDVQWLMGSQEGRRILWRLLDRVGTAAALLDDEYDPNAMNMANRAGKRHVVRRLVWLVREHCLPQWNLMFLENQENQK